MEPLTLGTFLCFVMQWDVNVPGLYPTPLSIPVDLSSAHEFLLPPLLLPPALQRMNLPRQNDCLGQRNPFCVGQRGAN